MFYAVSSNKSNYSRVRGRLSDDEFAGIFGKIGKGFKKVGKVVAKSGALSAIPGVGGFIQTGVDAAMSFGGGGNPNMDAKCANAKKAGKKDCVAYLAQKKQAEEAFARQQEEAKAKNDREEKQIQILQQLAEKNSVGGGIDQTTLLYIGGGLAAVVVLMTLMSNRN